MALSILVKFGGSVASGTGADPVLADLVALASNGTGIVLVHGGGPAVDVELRRLGIPTRRVAGLRVTDAPTLAIVEKILGRQVNAAIVSAIVAAGGRAERVAGDAGVFVATKLLHRDGDLGFVGQIVRVDPTAVRAVLKRGAIPVVSPIGVSQDGQKFNINADTAAGALAAALGVDAYIVVTDVPRVLLDRRDPTSAIARMTVGQASTYRQSGIFADGMIPKIDAAIAAVEGGVPSAIVCGAGPGAIAAALAGGGTTIAR